MVELTTIARPYAEAVFGLADKQGNLAKWSELLARLSAAAADPQLSALLGNPRVSAADLEDMLLAACGADRPTELRGLVSTLIENGRVSALPQVANLYEDLKNRREGVVEADIQTAFPLDAQQLSGLVADLERRYARKVQPRVHTNPDLIGGVRVTIGDEVIDGSVRAKLDAMNGALAN
jgi:F-type H+-transporting ATPase subunit delta